MADDLAAGGGSSRRQPLAMRGTVVALAKASRAFFVHQFAKGCRLLQCTPDFTFLLVLANILI
jgi:hypothetical protein